MTAVRRKRDPVATRLRLIEAANKLLVEGGGDLEMSWVATEAGVSQGLAYHHFGSKEGLISAVVNAFYDRLEEQVLMARLDEIPAWEERELLRTERYIRFLMQDSAGRLITTQMAQSPAVASVEAVRWQALVDEGARNIEEGQRQGVVGSSLDSEMLAAMVLGATRAAAVRALRSGRRSKPAVLAKRIWTFLGPGLELKQGVNQS